MIQNTSNDEPILNLFAVMSGIEGQEKQGQNQLVRSSQLPSKMSLKNDPKPFYEKLGIKVLNPSQGDELFLNVILPDGWKLKPTDHSMWNELIDHKRRVRATIFYKAAFYDRDAFISFERRYSFNVIKYLPEEEKGHFEMKRQLVQREKRKRYVTEYGYVEDITRPVYDQVKVWIPKYSDNYEEYDNTPHYFGSLF